MRSTLAIIMGGGQGSRLFPLTQKRSKPAVPLAGKYRLVDIPISNCINSGLRQIYILTQFNTESLHRHISEAYTFDAFSRDFVRILAAQQTQQGADWYQGTADAVRQNLSYFLGGQSPYQHFLILSGDQLYRMDFWEMMAQHLGRGADLTIATTPVERDPARAFGLMHTDESSRITRFVEKPGDDDALLDELTMAPSLLEECGLQKNEERFQASMGIYLFNRKVMEECLDNDFQDFGKNIIPASIDKYNVYSHIHQGYWEDIGTIRSFYEANIELTTRVPRYNFFDQENPIYSRARFLPTSKVNQANIENALISDGCILDGATVKNSLIGIRTVVEKNCEITESIVMGADYYERDYVQEDGSVLHRSIRIDEGTKIHKAILDKNVCIGKDVDIAPRDREDGDYEYCHIRDGIVVIPKSTVIPDGTVV
ncbi:MAG: glucose-1-phosphate adenylyltransferase [Verrucomicrobiales bacterium]|nr:glucose-1-phosphate adenylyltransferase [Verrucomicrobiales bacterium]